MHTCALCHIAQMLMPHLHIPLNAPNETPTSPIWTLSSQIHFYMTGALQDNANKARECCMSVLCLCCIVGPLSHLMELSDERHFLLRFSRQMALIPTISVGPQLLGCGGVVRCGVAL